ncbi:SAM-dependent methyltransferase [Nocardia testacea]|uniref:SAM-dependent methyltransferase n=1 Tax=Nocardia testacea TaxID=248551 RepID=UPI0009FC6E06|nr:SAM-dependent methyltransferase [Nocardia testacea]
MTDIETARPGGVHAPVGVDTTRPSMARVCNWMLGGKDNYAHDRNVGEQLDRVAPSQTAAAWASRQFQQRALRYLIELAGVRQFLDIGAGLPLPAPSDVNTHQATAYMHTLPDADRPTVVYVDHDPVCLAHGRVLLETTDQSHYVQGDLLTPGLAGSEAATYLELEKPVGVLLCGVLHHVDDETDPAAVVRGWVDAVPAGSYFVLTHQWNPGGESPLAQAAARCQDLYLDLMGSGWFRSREEISALFDGLELLDPGLVTPGEWWPSGPARKFPTTAESLVLAGVARKP